MTFAIIPFVPEFMELVIGGGGVWLWGYVKGRRTGSTRNSRRLLGA